MRIIAFKTIREFFENHPDSEQQLKAWYKRVKKANWKTPIDVKRFHRSASIVGKNRVVFNIKGNDYRLVVKIEYQFGVVYIRFIGTHNEYDKIDVTTILKNTKPNFMEIKPIKTEKDYKSALKRIDELFDTVKKGTLEGNEFEILTILVETYENEHYHIGTPDPIEAIKFSMEQMELKPKDLVYILGYKSRVSEILNGKRKLNIDMVRKLHKALKIPLESLI